MTTIARQCDNCGTINRINRDLFPSEALIHCQVCGDPLPASAEAEIVPPPPDPRPLTIGCYRLTRLLGEGGTARVFHAIDMESEREVALKILPPSVRVPQWVARFVREAEVARDLDHPHIVKVFDVGTDGEFVFFAMEFVAGHSLEALRKAASAPLPLGQVVVWHAEILAALSYAHGRGVLHRDVKPPNILITDAGRAMLHDFGIGGAHGRSRRIFGTPRFMAPEVLTAGEFSVESDIFAVGVSLYLCATGRRPFDGDTIAAVRAAILAGDYPPPSAVNPQLPLAVDALLPRFLASSPHRRFRAATDARAELLALADRLDDPFGHDHSRDEAA